jgi:hypothetical protein
MKKREQKFTTAFQKWLKYNMPESALFEIKYVRNNRYNFKSDKSLRKEMRVLKLARNKFIYKFSDFSRLGTPCDCIKLNQGEGYIVFTWDGKNFYIIEVHILEHHIKNGHKSLSHSDAKKICNRSGTL